MLSYWEKETFFAPQDVIIIGSGFTGLWTAITLKQQHPKMNILVLEKGLIPTGASTKNAGFSCFGSPTELINDATEYGEDEMWQLVTKRYEGLRKIHNTFSYTAIDYNNCGGYECLMQPEYEEVVEKLFWLNKGMQQITTNEKTFTTASHKKDSFGLAAFDYLIENRLEGYLQPAKLVQQLQQKAISLGIQLQYGVEVTQIEEATTIKLHTSTSNYTCKQLVITTNGFAKQLLPELDIYPARGQVFITAPIDNLLLKGTFHFNNGYYYFRNVNNRLLIGGARNTAIDNEKTTSFAITDTIQETLEKFVNEYILPHTTYTIEQRWSGIMGFGSTKAPIVKATSHNIFCAVRMSGMGVALAPIVAEEVAAIM